MKTLIDSCDVEMKCGVYGRTVIARLKPNEDIVESLEKLCESFEIRRAIVRSAVGSLIDGNLSVGGNTTLPVQLVKGPGVEIVGLFGEVVSTSASILDDQYSTELTAILSGTDSQVVAGRLVRGMNPTFITVEVTVQEWLSDSSQ
ncbi:PPC domain-containing DNA-binding protein [Caballeronia sp. TF1N1]|uniref:PPC domain-containing DNA-binding protein n=1 Tax=Caballeronia sp. TF1N1 TaxID=2878153 RepID=UPI001FD13C6D|nr:PPC domain-containing DNA-binding protein [Caballeronia sp. TF1N1]